MELLEKIFNIRQRGSSIRTEIIAGITTFVTMGYIIFVQPAVLSAAGMDFGAVLAATCLVTAFATIMMGLTSNHPLALAPAMGENFFFSFAVVIAMGISWQTALGIIFISGIIFLILTLFNIREFIIDLIPQSMKSGITVGIGLFITFIGLVFAGIVEKSPGGILQLGNVSATHVIIPIIGIIIVGVLTYFKIKGAILISIIACTIIALPFGIVQYHGVAGPPPSIMPTFLKMNLMEALSLKYVPLILVFLFMDVFDTVGTVVGATQQSGLVNEDGTIPRIKSILLTDATATTVGALLGTSTVTTYIESSAGIQEGGRTGFTAVVIGLLFLLALFFEPLAKMIGGGFTVTTGKTSATYYPIIAPALIIVGSMMVSHISRIDFSDVTESLPAFLIMVGMPLTYSIADGLAFGFISYPLLKILTGKIKKINPFMIVMGIIFILRYAFL